MQDRQEHEQAGHHILVVEDHYETGEMIRTLLEDEGYSVKWFNTTDQVLLYFSQLAAGGNRGEHPDLIILDLTMPGTDPVDMVRQLPSVPDVMAPAFVVMSAKPRQTVQQVARSIGAAGVVTKPFPIDSLLETVDNALSARRHYAS